MDILNFIWIDLLYRPVYNLVIFTYQTLPGHDLGLAIIYLSLLMRVLLLPASLAGSQSSRRVQELQPELQRLQRMPEVGRRRDLTRALLKRNRVNVYASAMVLLVQVAFLGILYQVFQNGLSQDPAGLAYFQVELPIDTTFLGLFDLAAKNWWMPLITAILLYVQLSLTTPEPQPGSKLSDVWYVVALPIGVFGLLLLLPSAKALFLLVSVLFSIGLYLFAKYVLKIDPTGMQDGAE